MYNHPRFIKIKKQKKKELVEKQNVFNRQLGSFFSLIKNAYSKLKTFYKYS